MPAANLVFLLACFLWKDDTPLAPERREHPSPIQQAGEHRDYREVFIPMRDGVRLHATLSLPPVSNRSALPRTPVIFTLTPYLAASYGSRAQYFASHGYGFASVDVRGRGDSGGVFEPYVHDSDDGYDVVEWLAKQPFCDGHVAMWGGSYAGFNQWATARKFPPHLSTIVPAAAAHPGVDAPYYSGTLAKTPPKGGADSYVYDPLDTRRGEKLEARDNDKSEMIDQRYAASIGKDGLVYETAPFSAETVLIGCPSVRLWLSLDAPDTDLEAYLYETQPDGTNIRLWTNTVRLRYRESLRVGKLVKPGEIVACDLAPGLFVSRRLMKGSRLRLVISSPNTILAEKNYNSGGVVASEMAKDARIARIRVYEPGHLSVLHLPLGLTKEESPN